MKKLSHRIKVTVPSNIQGRELSEAELMEHVEVIAKNFSQLYGGFTAHPAEGGWVNSTGELIHEAVVVVEALSAEPIKKRIGLFSSLNYILDTMKQDAVLVEVDGVGYILESFQDIVEEFADTLA